LNRLPPEARGSIMIQRVRNVIETGLGGVYRVLGQPEKGIPYLESVRSFCESLLQRDPQDMRNRFSLTTVSYELAQSEEEAGHKRRALELYRAVLQLLDNLLVRDPKNLVWQGHRSEAQFKFGALGKDERAVREALDVALKLAADREAASGDLARAAQFLLEV